MLKFLFFSLIILSPYEAQAYIEPGMGSLFVQAVLGGIVGSIVILKNYWYKILGFFSKNKSKDIE